MDDLGGLLTEIAACQICVSPSLDKPLPHEPRPVVTGSTKAKIAICGQAPGTRVHASGVPFSDPSGDRLRNWLGVDSAQFYNADKFAIIPMGFCFPGLNATGGDLPPRKECAKAWRRQVMDAMPQLELILAIGMYAQGWHLEKRRKNTLTQTVKSWREYTGSRSNPIIFPLPHPSWRNSGWIKKNEWFEAELLSDLQRRVKELL